MNTEIDSESTQASHALRDVKAWARAEGFDLCGIAAAGPADPQGNLARWLELGYHADMGWMARARPIREDTEARLSGAKSVVVVAKNYFSERPSPTPESGRVARYAWGRDYHRVMRKPMRRLARRIESLETGARTCCNVDSGPVLERSWAARAGVGSIGKNSLCLNRDLGSWFFIGVVVTTVELAADSPATDICGSCTACLDACPTGAIVEPQVVDSNRCISYHTIENRGEIPEALAKQFGDWVFGCDVCQEVCPWNRFAKVTEESDFHPRPGHANPALDDLARIGDEAFASEFEGAAIRRAKASGMRRNAEIAVRNQAD